MDIKDIDFNKDYYEILGIGRDATQDDIKKAFRTMSVKWHPDRHGDDSEEDKKKAEDKFKECNEAYSILSDEQLKAAYDSGGNSMFNNPFFGMYEHMMQESGEDSIVKLKVTLDDIIDGFKDRKIKYDRKVRCKKCGGSGGDKEKCPHCGGTGVITQTYAVGNSQTIMQRPCPYCGGRGYKIKNKCTDCNGTGVKLKHEEFSLTARSKDLLADGGVLYAGNFGSESRKPGDPNGKLLFVIEHDLPEGTSINVSMTGTADLVKVVNLPYWDMILGKKVIIETA